MSPVVGLGFIELLIIAAVVGLLVLVVNRNGRAVAAVVLGGLGLLFLIGLVAVALFGVRVSGGFSSGSGSSWTMFPSREGPPQELYIVDEAAQSIPQDSALSTPAAATPAAAEIESAVPDALATAEAASPPAATVIGQRPTWVDAPSALGEDGVYRAVGQVGPYATRQECEAAQPVVLRKLTEDYAAEYIATYFGEPQVPMAHINLPTVRISSFDETVDFPSTGPMIHRHVLLEIDPAAQQAIRQAYRDALVQRRVWYTGSFAGLALVALGSVLSYLKLDTLTRGYYSGRLKVAAGGIVAACAILGTLLARGNIGF